MNSSDQNTRSKIGAGGWIAIFALGGFLLAAIFYAVHGWTKLGGVGIPTAGWVVLIAGMVLTVLVGGGLMALMFYSSRKGRDI